MDHSPGDCVLAHQNPTHGYIGRRRPCAPSRIAGAVIERGEDELGGLVGGRFGQHGDGETGRADGMQHDGGVVEEAQNMHAERVDGSVRHQQRGVDADGFPRRGRVRRAHGRRDRDQIGQPEGDARRDGYLPEEIEPTTS